MPSCLQPARWSRNACVILYCIAVRRVAQWPTSVAKYVEDTTSLLMWLFPMYLLLYKGLWGFVQLFEVFSLLQLLGACFYTWLAWGPIKAVSTLLRKEVRQALVESAAAARGSNHEI